MPAKQSILHRLGCGRHDPMLIALDENAAYLTAPLRNNGYSVISITEDFSGIEDEAVLDYAFERQALLITEDKRFGEMIFRDGLRTRGVVLIRFPDLFPTMVSDYVLDVLNTYGTNLFGMFTVISSSSFRMHALRD
jgi:predicted nuclease of predicted toxin-antitoxin system